MVSTRRTTRTNSFSNNKMSKEQSSSKPLRPLPGPSSVSHVLLIVILNMCKNIIFVNSNVRVLVYVIFLFALSSIADVLPVPKFFTSDFLNQYFVKWGWFWTLFLTIPFVYMTSYTYCCGRKSMLYKHLARLAIATFFWFFWVNLFVYIEKIYGKCFEKQDMKLRFEKSDLRTRYDCTLAGHHWQGFDLSGHAFILIYSNLVLIEEARPILGWEGIRDLIRDENYTRINKISTFGPLRNLNTSDFDVVKKLYEQFLPYVRVNFFLITCLSITWDVMLLSTIMYFHSMPEKLFSGIFAIFTWYFTYELWYKTKNITPLSPGDGSFCYFTEKKPILKKSNSLERRSSISKFMGMPLATQNKEINF